MALTTPMTELFKIKHPVMLAGMAGAAGPELAAAVSNAGGLGNIGGVGFTPAALRKTIGLLKKDLVDKNAPFGVDLLLPQVGGGARKTNKDYTAGTLPELVDIIIEEKAALFICAVGVPPKWAVDKFHSAGIPVMNMIGAVKHVGKALEAGVDLICAQGGEGGGHTGDTATAILLPKESGVPAWVVDVDGLEGGFSVGILQQAEVLTQEEKKKGVQLSRKETRERGVFLSGQCAGAITDIKPAGQIVEEMVQGAVEQLQTASNFLVAKL